MSKIDIEAELRALGERLRKETEEWCDSPEGRAQIARILAASAAQTGEMTMQTTTTRHMTPGEIDTLQAATPTGQFFCCSPRRLPPQTVSVRYSPTVDGHWLIRVISSEGPYVAGAPIPEETILYTGEESTPAYIIGHYVRSLGHTLHAGQLPSLAGSPVEGWLHDRD